MNRCITLLVCCAFVQAGNDYWRLKPGAPEPIVKWFEDQPIYRAARLEDFDTETRRTRTLLQRKESELERVTNTPVPSKKRSRGPLGGSDSVPNEDAGREKVERMKQLRNEIKVLKAEVAQRDVDRKALAADRRTLVVPPLVAKVGAYGGVGSARVEEIIDKNTMRVSIGEQDYWLKGVKTEGMVDDKLVAPTFNFAITGTKTYSTTIGGRRTIYLAEPMNHEEWIEAIDKPKDVPF